MFRKILVANRGEIAIRAFRAAYELGARTVAVYPYEDRNSLHRLKADEAYLIGEKGHPVRAYLDVDEIIRVAKESGADAIYPGYGFLSENPDLAEKAAANGIAFIGPPARGARDGRQQGHREAPRDRGRRSGAALDRGIRRRRRAARAGRRHRLPDLRQGRRRRRRTRHAARRDARGARARARRGDARGRRARSATRACSSSRPCSVRATSRCRSSPTRPARPSTCSSATARCSAATRRSSRSRPRRTSIPTSRDALHRHAVAFAESIGYENAGTVEFLLETAGPRTGEIVFIEMNPRIQVEHTVTEEVTDVDLVQSQMRIAAGADPRRARAAAGPDPAARRGAAVPHHDGGPDAGLPPRHRQDHDLPLTRRCRHPPRRRHDRRRLADQPALRLDAREAHVPRPRLRRGRRARPARARGVPHPRRLHEHPVPAGGARRPRLRRRRREHVVHRRAPRSCCAAASRRTAAARCSTGSSTRRSTSRTARTRSPSTRA